MESKILTEVFMLNRSRANRKYKKIQTEPTMTRIIKFGIKAISIKPPTMIPPLYGVRRRLRVTRMYGAHHRLELMKLLRVCIRRSEF